MASNYMSPTSADHSFESLSSDSKIKQDFLDQLLICGICLSRMSLPCCLPCAHSFCRSCLLNYAQSNNINESIPVYFMLCPYCKRQFNFYSYEHFQSMLIVNPVLKQLCEALEKSALNSNQQEQQTQSNGTIRARCHTCSLLKSLKICKHCCFLLCDTCRRSHLLDIHRESKSQIDLLENRIGLINEKCSELNRTSEAHDFLQKRIQDYAKRIIHEIEQQRDHALQILNERQHLNNEAFWKGTGFYNKEKLDFFISLMQTGQKKLSAKHITDKELTELFDNLQAIPNVDQKLIESIQFVQLELDLDEACLEKTYIHIFDHQESSDNSETITNPNEILNDIDS